MSEKENIRIEKDKVVTTCRTGMRLKRGNFRNERSVYKDFQKLHRKTEILITCFTIPRLM